MLRILVLTLMASAFAPVRAHEPVHPPLFGGPDGKCHALLSWNAVSRAPVRHKEMLKQLLDRIGYVSDISLLWREQRRDGHRFQGIYAVGEHIILPRMMMGNHYRVGLWNRPGMGSYIPVLELYKNGLMSMQKYHLESYKNIEILVTEVDGLWESFDLMHVLNLYTAVALAPSAHLLQLQFFVRPERGDEFHRIRRMKKYEVADVEILRALKWKGLQDLSRGLEFPFKMVTISGWRYEGTQIISTHENPEEWEVKMFFALP